MWRMSWPPLPEIHLSHLLNTHVINQSKAFVCFVYRYVLLEQHKDCSSNITLGNPKNSLTWEYKHITCSVCELLPLSRWWSILLRLNRRPTPGCPDKAWRTPSEQLGLWVRLHKKKVREKSIIITFCFIIHFISFY